MQLRFSHHELFHRAAIGMVAGAFAFGVSAQMVAWPHGLPAGMIGGMLGAAFGAAVAYRHYLPRMLLAVLAIVPLLISPTWAAIAASAAITGLAVSIGTDGGRRFFTMAMMTAAGLLGAWVAIKVSFAEATHHWSVWLQSGVAAAGAGMVASLAVLPRHFWFAKDPVATAAAALPKDLDPEANSLCQEALAMWHQVGPKLGEGTDRELMGRAVVTILATATSDMPAMHMGQADIGARVAELEQRIANATDMETKRQYQSAKQTLDEQQQYRSKAQAERERTIAKLHKQVAELQKFSLAVAGHKAGGRHAAVIGRLADGHDADAAADA